MRDQLRRLEARHHEIRADLKVQQGDMEIAIYPNLPELYRRKVARLQRVLDDEETRSQAVEISARLLIGLKFTPAKNVATARSLLSVPWLNPRFRAAKNNRRLLGRRRYVLDGCGGRI